MACTMAVETRAQAARRRLTSTESPAPRPGICPNPTRLLTLERLQAVIHLTVRPELVRVGGRRPWPLQPLPRWAVAFPPQPLQLPLQQPLQLVERMVSLTLEAPGAC